MVNSTLLLLLLYIVEILGFVNVDNIRFTFSMICHIVRLHILMVYSFCVIGKNECYKQMLGITHLGR